MTIAAPDAKSTSVGLVGDRGVRRADVQLEAVAVERQRGVDEVDGVALPVEHLARHARDRRVVRAATSTAARSHPRVGAGVVVQERDVLAGRLAAAPWLHPPAKPRFSSSARIRASGNRAVSTSALPSPDALSTTITSSSG